MAGKPKFRPMGDRLLVSRTSEEEKTAGGIIIPDSAKEKPQEAEVIAVGNGKVYDNGERRAVEIKVGERVLFGKYSGNEIKLDGNEYLIIREEDVLGVMDK